MIYYCPFNGYFFLKCTGSRAPTETIIDRWTTVPIPPAPKLSSVTIDPETTALLILDIEATICKSPNCTNSIPSIYTLLTKARKNNMLVIYSLIPTGDPSDILRQIAPLPSEPIVK